MAALIVSSSIEGTVAIPSLIFNFSNTRVLVLDDDVDNFANNDFIF